MTLARSLSRERAKDTSLDYPEGRVPGPEDLVRRYGERRGLSMPESEIVVRAVVREREAEKPAPRRSKFAGLRLDTGRPAERPVPPVAERAPAAARMLTERERQQAQFEGLAAGYARAWSDAERMHRAGLPVLPHQATALERAGVALEAQAVNLSRDVRAALERSPELAQGIGQAGGAAALSLATGAECRSRLVLEERARGAVREWDGLERAYATAEKAYDRQGKREAGKRMEAFAQALKADRVLDGLLRERGQELGVAAGSRLERVVQAPDAQAVGQALTHELGLRQGRGMSMGM